ncbi:MAG: hypothetical protein JWM83_1992 [Candidatus Angelobacter sp.]|nr:hypothetical protein [Candidatus Angelobacter sp.]
MTKKRVPNFSTLNSEIADTTVTKSLKFLLGSRAILNPYSDLESYAFSAPEPLPKALKGFEHHFNVVRKQILRVFRSHSIFIGGSIVDEVLFSAIKDPAEAAPLTAVLQIIQDSGIHKPGVVVYPLHSFGISGVGFIEALGKEKFDLIIPAAGLAVRAQTNSLEGTIQFLEEATKQLNVRRRIPSESLEHYDRMSVLRWLTHNPLLVVKVRTFSGEYYENQAFIVIKLKIATAIIFMLSALETGLGRKSDAWTGTRSVNNYQTLDIKHYIVFEPRPRSSIAFESKRVPMNVSPTELAELTAVPVSISRGTWMRRKKFIQEICTALLKVEEGYLKAFLDQKDNSPLSRTYRKLFSSLTYFRRSFRLTADPGEAYVNLAVAFEVLLTDSYAKGVEARIQKRLRTTLTGVKGNRALNYAAKGLYKARSEVVHTGQTRTSVDVQRVRQAFIYAFVYVVNRLAVLSSTTCEPISNILDS